MTVRDFVNTRIVTDQGLMALIESASLAQDAFDLQGETPIDQLNDNCRAFSNIQVVQEQAGAIPEQCQAYLRIVHITNKAQDAYRRQQTWGRVLQSSFLRAKDIDLVHEDGDDDDDQNHTARLIPIQGKKVQLLVEARKHHVVLLGIYSSRGLPIVTFDAGMNPSIDSRFRPFMVGDTVHLGGTLHRSIDR